MPVTFDAETYRADSRGSWDKAATGWTARRAAMQDDTAAVSQWLVDSVDPRPGQTVLEVAAGLGDTGLLAAARVGPDGQVILTDGSDAMVTAAAEHAKAQGAVNVTARQMEAEWLDQGTATVDAVLCRWGYMLCADPEAAFREARRVLRPGGRIALAAWEPLDENPWIAVIVGALDQQGIAAPPKAGAPGMFGLAVPGQVEELLASGGFTDVKRATVDFTFRAASLDAWWEHTKAVSVSLSEAIKDLPPAGHYLLRDAVDEGYAPYVAADGSVELPARALMACAEA